MALKKVSIGGRPSSTAKIVARLDKPGTMRFTIDIDTGLHRRFKAQCAVRGQKMADVIRDMIEAALQE